MAIFDTLAAIENSAVLEAFRESLFAYPIVEGVHLLGLSVAVGLLGLVDLRLAGYVLKGQPVEDVVRSLRPWFVSGFAVVLATGLVLFFSKATIFYSSPLFWSKIVLIGLAGLNAVYFELNHQRAHRGVAGLPGWQLVSPKASGLISLSFWVTVIVLGRLLAYFQSAGA